MTHVTGTAEILASMGEAGQRLDRIGACEASAGNISVSIRETPTDLADFFPEESKIELPVTVPGLAGFTFFVTGTGSRLRDIAAAPTANVSAIILNPDGKTGRWFTSPDRNFPSPTSEFNSHLGVHEDQIVRRGLGFQALIHCQPPYVVTLSHIPALRNQHAFNQAIFRWEPETVVMVPKGIKVLDFMVPGGAELGENNVESLRDFEVVLWSKHGVMVRSDVAPLKAVDKVEYIETGAMYEYRDIAIGGRCEGLTENQSKAVVAAFGVETDLY